MISAMIRPAPQLEPTTSSEPNEREPSPGERAEQLAERVKADAREQAQQTYLRDTIVPEGGE